MKTATRRNSTRNKARLPGSFQGILWSAGIKRLDTNRDRIYIIHQILMYGSLKQIKWLLDTYGRRTVRETFLRHPQNIYTPQAFFFTKNIVLNLKKTKINEKNYVKIIH
ncbi:MAG: hypothetical protein HZA48_12095 [Planctomycetes bacterium]|nr:hypothetical protein [Planctomycetota bacterium]